LDSSLAWWLAFAREEHMDVGKELVDALSGAVNRLGKSLEGSVDELRTYAAERMLHLSTLIGQKGYQEALLAERDNVALKAGILAVDAGDRADAELLGLITGAIAVGARALIPRRA
jgi:hypothetical protein